jgi:copper(I)-binding protein
VSWRQVAAGAFGCVVLAGTGLASTGLAGCARLRPAAPLITLTSAYVLQPTGPGTVDGYLVIQNSGSADQLLAVRSSAGGTVMLRGPVADGAAAVRTVRALTIPGHSIVRLDPADIHLVIIRSGPMRHGTDITLTLVFARAGTVRVAAQVTNPQRGGNTYFGP